MNKSILFIFVFLMFGISLYSQTIERALLSSAGDELKNASVEMSFSIGDIIIDTKSNNEVTLTQGFHQTQIITTSLKTLSDSEIELKIYPNPFTDFVYVDIKNDDFHQYGYRLNDIEGKLLKKGSLNSHRNKLDFSSFKQQVYLFVIVNEKGVILKTFKLQSIHKF